LARDRVIWTTSAAFKTFRIPVAAFEADGHPIDLANIQKVRVVVGVESASGTIAIDDLEIQR